MTVHLLGLSALAAMILALGTNLYWLAQPVWVSTPEFLLQWHPNPQARIPLPGHLPFRVLPFYSSMRVWMRYGAFVLLIVSALGGIGVSVIAEGIRKRGRYAIGLALLALVLLDFWSRQRPMTAVEAEPVDLWLSNQPGKDAVAPFPFDSADIQTLTYRTLQNGKPFIGGLYGAYSTPRT